MGKARIRVSLEESGTADAAGPPASAAFSSPWGPDHRLWLVRADGEIAGWLEAVHAQRRVQVSMCVVDAWRGVGVASAALGRFLGLRAWPDAETLFAAIQPDDLAAAAVLRSAGFSAAERDTAGHDVWERPAPPAPRPRTGPERFVTAEGRIDRYPVGADDRLELLRWVAGRALSPGEVLSERVVNERLSAFTGDVALLRRHLVDHGVLVRTRSGSEYARAP